MRRGLAAALFCAAVTASKSKVSKAEAGAAVAVPKSLRSEAGVAISLDDAISPHAHNVACTTAQFACSAEWRRQCQDRLCKRTMFSLRSSAELLHAMWGSTAGNRSESLKKRTVTLLTFAHVMQEMDKPKNALKLLSFGVSEGILHHHQQAPWPYFVRGLRATPLWRGGDDGAADAEATDFEDGTVACRRRRVAPFPLAATLEAHYEVIREEVLALMRQGVLAKHGKKDLEGILVRGGSESWLKLKLHFEGRKTGHCDLYMPRTCELLDRLPEVASQVKGIAKVSLLMPGSQLKRHYGPTNTRIRVHLPIQSDPGAAMRLCNITTGWTEGRALVFDDSFEHEVWHNGSLPRVVLIVDAWHPDMTEQDRMDSIHELEEKERYLSIKKTFEKNRWPWMLE